MSNISTSQERARDVVEQFAQMGFKSFSAFLEVLKKNPTITDPEKYRCWDGLECSLELYKKIELIFEILREGEHPLKFIVDGEFFIVDHAFYNIDYKGRKRMMYSKKVGSSTFTAPSLNTLKALCDNHREFKHDLTGEQMGYGKGQNMGD